MDIPSTICGRWICALAFLDLIHLIQPSFFFCDLYLGRLIYTSVGMGPSQEKVEEEERRQEREEQIVQQGQQWGFLY